MNQIEAIERVRKEASQNPAVNAVMHVWAMRQRARSQITVKAVAKTMKRERFDFKTEDYERIMQLLAVNGFGHLQRNPKGRVTGLKDIKVTLQSLGLAACGQGAVLRIVHKRPKFVRMHQTKPAQPPIPTIRTPAKPKVEYKPMILTVSLGGRTLDIPLPADITDEELSVLVRRHRD